MVRARAIATRCFSPPDRRAGIGIALVVQPDAVQVLLGDLDGLGLRQAADADGRLDQVAGHGHVREEVEVLEDHLGGQPQLADLLAVLATPWRLRGSASRRTSPTSTVPTVGSSRKFVQRRSVDLAAPRPTDDADRLLRVDLEVAAAQDVVGAEVLLDAGQANDRRRARPGSACPAAAIRIDASRRDRRSQPHVAHGHPPFEPSLEVREEDRQRPVDESRDEQRLDELAVAAADGVGAPQELLERRRR